MELVERIGRLDPALPGLKDQHYHLAAHERLDEEITASWNKLRRAWGSFRVALEKLPEDDPATKLTHEQWLMPLFAELGYGKRLGAAKAGDYELDGRAFEISHAHGATPIHLLGWRVSLEHRDARVPGAANASPHGLVQDFLNRSDDHLWGFVSNGRLLRILRDHYSLTQLAFVELDLEAMFEGEQFYAFKTLWLLCHESRVAAERPSESWLERWFQLAKKEGVRSRDKLRDGVQAAIVAFGRGFLDHPDNRALETIARAEKHAFYRELLRLVFRWIFLFVAEDRGLLLDPDGSGSARERYLRWYSTRRIRDLAIARTGTPHIDLWEAVRLVMGRLDDGCPELALPALGSFLWRAEALPNLGTARLANEHLLSAVRALSTTIEGRQRYPVNWRNIDAEELGSVYESLLELVPDFESGPFDLKTASGHERKTTGSYYTPSSLVDCLLDSALDPVLDEAVAAKDPEAALLDLKVCDPACGSGHFLVAAGRRIARRLASVRSGDAEPSPEEMRHALRDVVGRCLYGVDVNEMAVELCKVSLWMEALEPGRPLSFLESHILCGNSLLGATPELMAKGIPDEAFTPLTGDDKKVCSALKKRNKAARKGQESLDFGELPLDRRALRERALRLEQRAADDIGSLREKEAEHAALLASDDYAAARFLADAWCAAFVWPKRTGIEAEAAIAEDVWRRLQRKPESASSATREIVDRIAKAHSLFHWHLAFPQVFERSGSGGFDVVLGNPPWERINLSEKEWFATRSAEVVSARNASARKKLIAKLEEVEPELWRDWRSAVRGSDAEGQLVRNTGRFPLCGRGDINTYAVFAELNRTLVSRAGRAGCIVPAGIAMDDTTKEFFDAVASTRSLVSLFHFENEDRIFPSVHNAFRFVLITLAGSTKSANEALFVAYARGVDATQDAGRTYSLSSVDLSLLNPVSRTFATFRSRRDADLNRAIYARVPVLGGPKANSAGRIDLGRMLHMADDSPLFRTRGQLDVDGWELVGNAFVLGGERMLPLYEAKMVHQYDHRYGTYEGQTQAGVNKGFVPQFDVHQHADPNLVPLPRYWVAESEVEARLEGRLGRGWLLGWRDICRNSDGRTVIACIIPRVAVGHGFPLCLPGTDGRHVCALLGTLSSFVFDYCARQKVGGTHLTIGVLSQLPVLPHDTFDASSGWSGATLCDWVRDRVLELTYTAWDLAPFAMDCGYDGPPFRWDPERRFLLRCELDAAFFHLYSVARDDVDYIMDSFWIVRAQDEKKHGGYRTKERILELYDRLRRAIDTGVPYQTVLDPPPADPRVAHAARLEPTAGRPPAEPRPLVDGSWIRPHIDERNEAVLVLAAVLRALPAAAPAIEVRRAALLALHERLLLPALGPAEAGEWRRLTAGASATVDAQALVFAVTRLLGSDRLREDRAAGTWAAGPALEGDALRAPWAEGRAAFVLRALPTLDVERVDGALSTPLRELIHAT